ncbi:MAG: RNA-binding cell elongation regulator Jag/EloR [Bacillota bacterium]
MEIKKYEFVGKHVEDAVAEGLKTLEITQDQAEIEILDQGGFLRKAKVSINKKLTESVIALNFVETALEKMGVSAVVEMQETDEAVVLNVISMESGTVIGHRGDVLDAIQYIASILANQDKDSFKRIVVDCENYRERRIETLKELAVKMCEKAVKLRKKIHLEPMNPFERRIIHAELTGDDRVKTVSEGDEPLRHLVIVPNNLRPFDNKRRPGGGKGGFNRDNRGGNGGFNRDNRDNRNGGNGGNGGYNRDRKPREDGEKREFNRDNRDNRDNRNGGRRDFKRNDRPFEERAPRPKTDFSSFAYLGKSETPEPENKDAE